MQTNVAEHDQVLQNFDVAIDTQIKLGLQNSSAHSSSSNSSSSTVAATEHRPNTQIQIFICSWVERDQNGLTSQNLQVLLDELATNCHSKELVSILKIYEPTGYLASSVKIAVPAEMRNQYDVLYDDLQRVLKTVAQICSPADACRIYREQSPHEKHSRMTTRLSKSVVANMLKLSPDDITVE